MIKFLQWIKIIFHFSIQICRQSQPRSQGLSSSAPHGVGRWKTLGKVAGRLDFYDCCQHGERLLQEKHDNFEPYKPRTKSPQSRTFDSKPDIYLHLSRTWCLCGAPFLIEKIPDIKQTPYEAASFPGSLLFLPPSEQDERPWERGCLRSGTWLSCMADNHERNFMIIWVITKMLEIEMIKRPAVIVDRNRARETLHDSRQFWRTAGCGNDNNFRRSFNIFNRKALKRENIF